MIADLTGSNPNVFYELAIRHAIRKPLIQVIQKDEKIPFDVAGMRTIPVDHRDLDSVQEAKQEIEKQIKAVSKKRPEEIESPISVSVELQALRHSDNPEERSFAEFVSVVAELRSEIAGIDKRLSSPENLIPPQYILKCMELASRRTPREFDIMIPELAHRLDRLCRAADTQKSLSPDLAMELDRLREMLMMMRHEVRLERP